MKDQLVQSVIDARQTHQWGTYLEGIGWKSKKINQTYALIRRINFLHRSIIKIQHPLGPLPFDQIEELAQKEKALFVLIEPHCFKYNETFFIKYGYQKSKMLMAHTATIKIDITQDEKSLFKSFSENAKRNIRKSQRNNLVIKPVFMKGQQDTKYFDLFYKLLTNLKNMKHFYAPSYEEYSKKMAAFKETSILLFAYEKNDQDNPIGVVWLAGYGNVASYFQTGIITRGYELLANYLLVWEGLKLIKKLGYEVFDFETIYDERYPKERRSWRGYTEFKKRFHGTIIEYPPPWIKFYNVPIQFLYNCFNRL